jgi:hypothetical protein
MSQTGISLEANANGRRVWFLGKVDQTKAIAAKGPHGTSFEKQAAKFHISFTIGDAQPEYQSADRIRIASQACAYRFRVTEFKTNDTRSSISICNQEIKRLYDDA